MSFSYIFIVAVLVTGGASSDKGLLMEQASIDRMLDDVRNLGDKRVDGQLPADQQERVAGIKQIMSETVLPGLQSVKDDTQNELNTLIAAISTCNSNSVTLHQEIGGISGTAAIVNVSRANHTSCRGGGGQSPTVSLTQLAGVLGAGSEADTLAAMNAACADLSQFIETIPEVAEQPTNTLVEEHIAYLQQIETRRCGWHGQLVEKKNRCDNATSDHESSTRACNHLQAQFEQSYCAWRLQLTDACSTLMSCYGDAVQSYTTRSAAVQVLEGQWRTEYTGIQKILCYIDIWMSDNNVTTVSDDKANECDNLSVDTSPMDVTYSDVPPQGSCETSQVQQYPGTAEFAAREYSQFSNIAESAACPDPSVQAGAATNADPNACETNASPPVPCVFPMLYQDVTYNTCTSAVTGNTYGWCATATDANDAYTEWGRCADGCVVVPPLS